MNILDVMSAKNPLREEHISYLLGWFLDPSGSHGLGGAFLQSFIGILAKQDESLLSLKNAVATVLPLAVGAEQNVRVTVINERQIDAIHSPDEALDEDERAELQSSFALDIVVEISIRKANVDESEDWIIAIENKTKVASQSREQLIGQFNSLPGAFPGKQCKYVYLAPQINSIYEKLEDIAFRQDVLWMTWDDEKKMTDREVGSFVNLVDEFFGNESVGRTTPIPTETRYILKCLANFCMNGFGRTERVRRGAGTSAGGGVDGWGNRLETSAHRVNGAIVAAGERGLTASEIAEQINEDIPEEEIVGFPRIRAHIHTLREHGKVVSAPADVDGRQRVRYVVTDEGLELWHGSRTD